MFLVHKVLKDLKEISDKLDRKVKRVIHINYILKGIQVNKVCKEFLVRKVLKDYREIPDK